MARAALAKPLQAGASRATTGEDRSYRHLEKRLARFFRVEDALIVPTGYLASITACQAMGDQIDNVLLDDRAHACVADGARLTGRRMDRFAHGELDDLGAKLKKLPRDGRPLIACDGTLGTHGGLTPLAAYLEMLPRRGFLLVDDAHGAGTVGPGGRGLCALLSLQDPRIIQTISLAKAFGVSGGAILGTSEVINAARTCGPGWIGSTAPLVPAVAALEAALDLVLQEPQRVKRLQANAQLLNKLLPQRPEIRCHPNTPIAGIIPQTKKDIKSIRNHLIEAGIFPPLIHYLNGPKLGFYRFAVLADHSVEDITRLANALSNW